MQEIIAFNEQRAEIYWWLSSLFAKELTSEDLEHYQSYEIRTFLDGLAQTPELSKPMENVKTSLNQLMDREEAQLELAADFCGLFLSTPKSGALPYASMYVGKTGLLNDKPAQDMNALMSEYGISQRKEFNEPADHLAIQLDFLGNLIIRTNEQEKPELAEELMQAQLAFLKQHLLNWLPAFAKDCQERDKFGFYAAVSHLLLAFCQLDETFLIGE